MKSKVSVRLLEQLSKLLAHHAGLYFSPERYPDLERGICTAAKDFGHIDAESCINWLTSSVITKNHIEILASHLTIGETYFFRDQRSFEVLGEQILPELISSRQGKEHRLRIWSAGSSSGEEAYSIAMSCYKVIPNLQDWQITILATDINPFSLQKASRGVFRPWSFRETPHEIKEQFFQRTAPGCFQLNSQIKEMVSFSYLNLVEDTYPSILNNTNAMDIIFCRNVLMYLIAEKATKVVENLCRSLVNGGWLFVSPNDIAIDLFPQLSRVKFPGAILYRKESTQTSLPIDWFAEVPSDTTPLSTPEFALSVPEPLALPATDLLEKDSKDTDEIFYRTALRLYEEGKYRDAEELLSALARSNAHDARVFALLARVYANEGNLAQALEWAGKATSNDMFNPVCHYLQATILQEQGEGAKATVHLKRCLYLDPDFVLAHFALGNQAYQHGKLKEANRYFTNAKHSLKKYKPEETVLEAEGLTAGRLSEIITSVTARQATI